MGRGGNGMVLPRNATTEYLKNIVIQYMASEEAEVREHMEGAIATVLQFTDTDVAFVRGKRATSSWMPASLAGLWGGGGGAAGT